jgi:hypothetical protein
LLGAERDRRDPVQDTDVVGDIHIVHEGDGDLGLELRVVNGDKLTDTVAVEDLEGFFMDAETLMDAVGGFVEVPGKDIDGVGDSCLSSVP